MIRFCLAASIFLYGGTVQAGQMTAEQCHDTKAAYAEVYDTLKVNLAVMIRLRLLIMEHSVGSCNAGCQEFLKEFSDIADGHRMVDNSITKKGPAAFKLACQEFMSK